MCRAAGRRPVTRLFSTISVPATAVGAKGYSGYLDLEDDAAVLVSSHDIFGALETNSVDHDPCVIRGLRRGGRC